MADSPKLPSTSDSTGYAPYSVTAMLAAGLAGLFAVFLVILGLIAFWNTQHFVQPLMLAMPMIALVLSFAGRRQIKSSEGTRIGYPLCNFAWWVAMVGGMGYAAYLLGIGFAVRTDAAAAVKIWSEHVAKSNLTDANDAEFYEAFRGVAPTGRQMSISYKSPAAIADTQKVWKEDLVIFRQIDVMRIAHRNKGAFEIVPGGLSQWVREPSGALNCTMNAVMKCPEGHFELTLQMMQDKNSQQEMTWQIVLQPQGFVKSAKLTNYGFLIRDLETAAATYVYQDMLPVFSFGGQNAIVLPTFAGPMSKSPHALSLIQKSFGRMAAIGGAGFVHPEPNDFSAQIATQFFTPLDNSEASAEKVRELYLSIWRGTRSSSSLGRISPPGTIIAENRDTAPVLTLTDKLATIKVPIELQVPNGESSQTGARGAAILVCDDPTLFQKLKDARAAAASETPVEMQERSSEFLTVPWKLSKFESDMKPVKKPTAPGGGPPGPQ